MFLFGTDVSEQSGSREVMAKAAELKESVAQAELHLSNVTKVSWYVWYRTRKPVWVT